MNFARKCVVAFAVGYFLSVTLKASGTDSLSGNPYSSVVARNIFGLMPMPTNPPVDPSVANPPPKITPNGIMNLLGDLQALFKVAVPPKAGQPPHDDSYCLSEGERQDDIEVVKIDEKTRTITFNNHGTIQELALADASASSGSSSSGPTGGPNPGVLNRPFGRPGGPFGRVGFNRGFNGASGGRSNDGNASQGNFNPAAPASGNTPAYGNGSAPVNGNNNSQSVDGLSPEAQALLIEKNYLDAKASDPSTAALYPPTPLRAQSDASQ